MIKMHHLFLILSITLPLITSYEILVKSCVEDNIFSVINYHPDPYPMIKGKNTELAIRVNITSPLPCSSNIIINPYYATDCRSNKKSVGKDFKNTVKGIYQNFPQDCGTECPCLNMFDTDMIVLAGVQDFKFSIPSMVNSGCYDNKLIIENMEDGEIKRYVCFLIENIEVED